jgi:large subunit ribosomal protein L20
MHGLKLSGVGLNRKMLSEIAIHEPEAFAELCGTAKSAV